MEQKLILPLVEHILNCVPQADFSKIRIIGCQHILETTHSMFQSLFRLGLKPKSVSLIGKCYSTCREVYYEMLDDGIDVSPLSFSYSSHQPFDTLYKDAILKFISERIEELNSNDYELVVVLDDGGKFITQLDPKKIKNLPIVAIEQTSAGFRQIQSKQLHFPVINVARSPAKLTLESPLIAEAAADRLEASLKERNLKPENCLIIGAGPIGKAVQGRLSHRMFVETFDIDPSLSNLQGDLFSALKNYQLIIGCTGTTSIPHKEHSKISDGTILVSASSSDREFDAVYLRQKLTENSSCHQDLLIQQKLLLKSGFPVNFDGERENIDPEHIQLTIALITAGILQASVEYANLKPQIEPLRSDFEEEIVLEFAKLNVRSSMAIK